MYLLLQSPKHQREPAPSLSAALAATSALALSTLLYFGSRVRARVSVFDRHIARLVSQPALRPLHPIQRYGMV